MEAKYYTNDAVELLKELITIPSISRDETRAADKLAEYLNYWNLPFGREEITSGWDVQTGIITAPLLCSMRILIQ